MEDKKKVSDLVQEIYSALDETLDDVSKKAKVTCKVGCAHCCELLAMMTFSEAILIAEKLLEKPDWKDIAQKLKVQAEKACFDGISEVAYFEKRVRCSFLSDNNTCAIYEIRPACCRYHVVISEPSLCSFENRKSERAVIDLRQLESVVWDFSARVCKDIGLPPFVSAPIPVMALHSMLAIAVSEEDKAFLKELTKDIPNPLEWLNRYVKGLSGGKGGGKAVPIKLE